MIHFKNLILFLFAAFTTTVSIAQISHGGFPVNWDDATYYPTFEVKSMPIVDVVAAAAEDAVTDQFKDAPWRFGLEREVLYNLENSGTISLSPVFREFITCLIFLFFQFFVPETLSSTNFTLPKSLLFANVNISALFFSKSCSTVETLR